MKITIRSPFKLEREASKSVTLPSVVKLTDGTLFYTMFPEIFGQTSSGYDCTTISGQMNAYSKCSPVNAIVNKQADALRNGQYYFVDTKGNPVTSSGNKALERLFKMANPIQTWRQFISNAYAMMKIHGIAYCLPVYGAFPWEPVSIYVIPNFMVTPRYTRRVFQQSSLSEIIEGYQVEGINRLILPNEMLILRDGGVSVDMTFDKRMIPQSRLVAVNDSINAVIASTDAWVTIAKRKGMPLGIISSGGKDATSTIPLTQGQKEEVHNELNTGYGMSGSMKKFIITAASLSFQAISVPTKELMYLEGIEANTRIICNAFNYPFRLMEYDTGSSLSNGGEVKEARKMLYTEQIIPDAEMISETISDFFRLGSVRMMVSFDHLEVFQKSKEETARALLSLTAGLEKPYQSKVITLEEYRQQLAEFGMTINPDQPYGKTYYTTASIQAGQGAD